MQHANPNNAQANDPFGITSDGMSGMEGDPVDLGPADDSDPETPPNRPLADEKRAVIIYAARNRLNTVDARPGGFAWFSA